MQILIFFVLAAGGWLSGLYAFRRKDRTIFTIFIGLILQLAATVGYIVVEFSYVPLAAVQTIKEVSRYGTIIGGAITLFGLILFSRTKNTRFNKR